MVHLADLSHIQTAQEAVPGSSSSALIDSLRLGCSCTLRPSSELAGHRSTRRWRQCLERDELKQAMELWLLVHWDLASAASSPRDEGSHH